ncbi:MAG: rhodanese-like domain-containing protein [Anaerolineales bacterium]
MGAFLRKPLVQLMTVILVVLVVVLIALSGKQNSTPAEVSVDEAYQMYQSGTFVLDVSWQAEWDAYHLPNSTLIPLDQLYGRFNEVPKDRPILVVSHSAVSSQQARDLLISGGLKATSMAGDLSEWYAKGYPIEGAPPQ